MEAEISVLVVEDNTLNLKVGVSLLKKLGVQVDTAKTGEEAVEAVKGKPYSLILMDLELPGMDGLSATREIRRWQAEQFTDDKSYTGPIIVATTAHEEEDIRRQCFKAGMDDVITKPIAAEDLQNLIRKYGPGRHRTPQLLAEEMTNEVEKALPQIEKTAAEKAQEFLADCDTAQPDSAQSTERDLRQMVIFSLGVEKYAIDVKVMKRIVWAGNITPVPGIPAYILGILNLGGDIVSAVDLRQLLGLKMSSQSASKSSLMVTSSKGIEVGLVVDSVDDVIDLPARSIDPPLITMEREYADFLEGEARIGETLIAILNYERIMASDKMRLVSAT